MNEVPNILVTITILLLTVFSLEFLKLSPT